MEPGTVLGGRYTLTRELTAPGGDAPRWAATDSTLKRDVTIVAFPEDDPHAGATLDGARRVASTVDQRLARVLDVGEHNGTAFIVVESLEHADKLSVRAAEGSIHPEEARRIIGEAASALESARLRGLHHQRLSPALIRVAKDGSVSVSGVATAAALAGIDDTSSEVASRADALGLVACLYAALTGTWPLPQGAGGLPAAPRRQDGSLKSPGEIAANVPHDLDDLCHSAFSEPGADGAAQTLQAPGDVARLLAPWSADPITADVAHLDHVAAPVLGAVSPDDPWGEDDWDEDDWEGEYPESGFAPAAAAPVYEADPLPVEETAAYRSQDELDYPGAEYDADDDYEDERPVAAAVSPRRSRSEARVAIALVAGFVIVAIALATLGLITQRSNPWNTPGATADSPTASDTASAADTGGAAPGTPAPPATQTPGPGTSEPSTSAAGGAVTVAGARILSPQDDAGRPSSYLYDGNPGTVWTSLGFRQQDRSHRPIAVALDLGSEQQVGSVTVTFPGGTYAPNVYVGGSPSTDGATKIGSSGGASGSYTAQAQTPAKGRYVIIQFTQAGMPPEPVVRGYPYAVQIADVKVSG